MNSIQRINIISLEPEVSMLQVVVVWGEEIVIVLCYNPWLMVREDMLLMVHLLINTDQSRQSNPNFSNRVLHPMRIN
jgi:hypothetical protein